MSIVAPSPLGQSDQRARHRFPWKQAVATVLAIAILALTTWQLLLNPRMQWPLVGEYLFAPKILEGLGLTVFFTLVPMVFALAIGTGLALLSAGTVAVLRWFANAYIWFFRAVPLIIQLIAWFNIALVIPHVGISGGWEIDTNDIVTGLMAALIGLTLHEAALVAEVMRGGIISVPAGQIEAGQSLGLPRRQVMRRIVLPQTVRVSLPPLGNNLIGLLKGTSLVSVIGAGELLTQAQRIYALNYAVIPLLIVVTIWYLALTLILTLLQRALERYLENRSRGQYRPSGNTQAVSLDLER